MKIGKVVGTMVSTRKHEALQGFKLLIIQPYYGINGELFVAADNIGAGVGQLVLISFGEAVQHACAKKTPIDAIVVGIVDDEPIIGS